MDLQVLNFSGQRRLPDIRAAEAAECGLACLAMVARYHGHDIDLNGLRQRFPLSIAGSTLSGLIKIADHLQLTSRPLRMEVEHLRDLQTPAILHWDMNHFVALRKISRRGATIHDPTRGVIHLSNVELSKHFTGIALELAPTADFRAIHAREGLRLQSLWQRTEGFGSAIAQVLGLSMALQVVMFALPFQLQLVIDEGVMRSDIGLLGILALAFGGLVVVQAIVEITRAWLLQVFSQMLSFQMVGNVVRHLMRIPSEWFEKRHVGDILSRVASANAIQDILTKGVITALIDGLMAITSIIILFIYSPTLAVTVLAAVTLSAGVALVLFPIMRARNETQIVERAREQSHLMETIRAATTIKLMGREADREGAWRNLFANTVNAGISVGKYQITLTTVQGAITGLQTVLVVYLGARQIIAADGFSIGMLVAFLSFRQTFTDRTNALINQMVQFKLIGLHLDRLSDIVCAEREVDEGDAQELGSASNGALSLRGVTFRYGATDRTVLEDLNLDVCPGEFLAITGPSGGGKSTLLKIMLGLRTPTQGEVTLGGHRASQALWRAWRNQVGLVAQDDRLLSGSIADNIAFFDPNMDMRRVHEAAAAAQVRDEIMAMPMQFRSLVGDMGSVLSGGQKQRVLLARALYRDPKILILDEGTANLDLETEEIVADLIASMNSTRIVVAHRPALLRRADRILHLEHGQLRPDHHSLDDNHPLVTRAGG